MKINFSHIKFKSVMLLSIIFIIAAAALYNYQENRRVDEIKNKYAEKKELKFKTKKARSEYFFNLLRDPATNSIPSNIRQRELQFAKNLKQKNIGLAKTNSVLFNWYEAGPNDVGGRTRALAVDRTNSQVIIAGGASGGIWKSVDAGNSWHIKSRTDQQLSVTFVLQDPREGFENIWYYGSGEIQGTVAGNIGGSAKFYGSGLYKSIDNGETWFQIQNAGNPTLVDTPFDNISKIVINPQTGTLFVTSAYFGVLRSTDGGETFSYSLVGNINDHTFCEMDVAADGTLLATLSTGLNHVQLNPPGLYKSTDDGLTWENITPDNYNSPNRAMVAFAPSNNNIAYLWAEMGNSTSFYKINVADGTSEDRTENLPQFPEPAGHINTQGSYNMILTVKPDDENFVLFGATNLYRSRNGFATPANNESENWIGGYDPVNDFSRYTNHHSDQHSLFFDPFDPNKLWSGHDGGISYTDDITSNAEKINWIKKNNGYNVTQFYHVAVSKYEDDIRLLGGTQDNGTPYFLFDGTNTSASVDASSGDGTYSYIADNYVYTSAQEGAAIRFEVDLNNGGQLIMNSYSFIRPKEAQNFLFIHPYSVDINNEDIMYFPDGNKLWRNNSISTIQNQSDQDGITEGWINLGEVYSNINSNYRITAVTSSVTPAHILYLGLTSNSGEPKIIKLENSDSAVDGFTDISIPGVQSGVYLHQIAVNPYDADEFIVVFTNYNIPSIFHTSDGGQTYTNIDGNLEGTEESPGPSIRNASILPYNPSTKVYLLATSTGVYSTTELNGANTVWIEESPELMGNVVVASITSRTSDGFVAAATHGRGIFVAEPTGTVGTSYNKQNLPDEFILEQNYPNPFNPTTKISYQIKENNFVTLKVFDSIGREVTTLINKEQTAGNYSIDFNASSLASGVYYYRLSINNKSLVKKMILLR